MDNTFINPYQNLGSICHNPFIDGFRGTGEIRGIGNLTGDGIFDGTGVFCGEGDISGYGLFWVSGLFNGDVEGYRFDTDFPTGNGKPFVTFSGYCEEDYSFSNLIAFNTGTHLFSGADTFYVNEGMVTGRIVSGYFEGVGKACGTGYFYVDGHIEASGNLKGTGVYNARGYFYKGSSLNVLQPCVLCASNLACSGDFRVSGSYSGTGSYLQISKDFVSTSGALGKLVSGEGLYVASGVLSGWSQKIYYGFGVFTGNSIVYSQFPHTLPQEVYGTGKWNGTGWIRSASGYYTGYGQCRGIGTFTGIGFVDSLEANPNLCYASGCVSGYGTVFGTDLDKVITGMYCLTQDYDAYLKSCYAFPSYLQNCSDLGTLALKIGWGGNCVKYDRSITHI